MKAKIFERPASMGFGHWLSLYEVIMRIEDNQWRAKAKVAVLFLIQKSDLMAEPDVTLTLGGGDIQYLWEIEA